MAILKRNLTRKTLTTVALKDYIGGVGERTKNQETGAIHLHDGITPGGFEVSDDNTLTIEEIKALTENVYRKDVVPRERLIPANTVRPYWEFLRTPRDWDGLGGCRLKDKWYTHFSDIVTVPHDYVTGTDLDFYFVWTPTDDDGGRALCGLIWSIVDSDTRDLDPINSLGFYLDIPEDSESIIRDDLMSTYKHKISGVGIKPGDLISFRFHRNAGHKEDTYGDDIYVFTCGFKYTGTGN